ncbi:glucosamine-6-phosphate deaminase [Ureibacillus massiliensis 4400831 = CIP 108448 = CCUG 49529]|uniref:Glucosamine-6-phosphate deaminase n=1 Tax=Ureibacillus massiliensis 4400831 = CIP 108448 = CCUG 49529 TaxID=1211035 RepID=A0A0A3IRW6_9BACL|nr:glucosamine-6-phosphate deaminase [Ureibacillus massiliensis]KGR87441.1 glucosamine-6-phosphate deaminase [Ureibacillus massiliensis 4400831 = CIP 108448 = CCUG 49529]
MKIIKVKDYQEMSRAACEMILEKVKNIKQPVLGLATGSTPEGLYRCMVQAYKGGKYSFQHVITFNLDEYLNLDQHHPNSYHFYMRKKLFDHVDIPKKNIHIPNGVAEDIVKECRRYDERIKSVGNIDIQVLGLGINGHIGFNEPGTSFTSTTHVVHLDEITRKANSKYFHNIQDVPYKAITMGIGNIMESKEILLLVSGKKKALALVKLINGEVCEQFPASILKRHKNVTIIADYDALTELI